MGKSFDEFKVKDRSGKVHRRSHKMPVHGQSLKALLIERAAKAQKEARDNRASKAYEFAE
jgi:hypothetical protein